MLSSLNNSGVSSSRSKFSNPFETLPFSIELLFDRSTWISLLISLFASSISLDIDELTKLDSSISFELAVSFSFTTSSSSFNAVAPSVTGEFENANVWEFPILLKSEYNHLSNQV